MLVFGYLVHEEVWSWRRVLGFERVILLLWRKQVLGVLKLKVGKEEGEGLCLESERVEIERFSAAIVMASCSTNNTEKHNTNELLLFISRFCQRLFFSLVSYPKGSPLPLPVSHLFLR